MYKPLHIIFFLCLCIFQVNGTKVCAVSDDKGKAVNFIKKTVTEALDIVNNNGASDDEKRKKLSECINKYLDIDRTAQAVFSPLGYKDLSEEDKKKVNEYLKKHLIRFYAGEGKLSAMVNAKLSSDPTAEQKGNDFAVTTQFEKNSAPSATIVWVTTGSEKVFYVEVEGINQIITLRSEMQAAVGSGSLMDYINKKA